MNAGQPVTGGVDRPETAPGVDPRVAALGPRFWPKVRLTGPVESLATCWRFVGGEKPQQGGRPRLSPDAMTAPWFSIRGRTLPASRVAYELAGYGSTEGVALSNECGDESCCRPSHHTRRAYRTGVHGRPVLDYLLRDGAGYAPGELALLASASPVPSRSRMPATSRPAATPPATYGPTYGHATDLLTRQTAAARRGLVSDAELRAALADPARWTAIFGTKDVVVGEVRGGWIVGVPWGTYTGPDALPLLREALAAMPAAPAAGGGETQAA